MRIRSKIAWRKLAEARPDKEGTYFVAFFPDKKNEPNVLTPVLAEWHTTGDIIEMHNPALQAEDVSGAKGEMRKLLSRLGGSYVPYEVKEDGFYLTGANWDFVQGSKGEDGCVEYVDYLGQDVFWADIPLMPEGYITDDEKDELDKTNREDRDRQERDEKAVSMPLRFETDEFLKVSFPLERTFPDGISTEGQMEVSRYGVLYRLPSTEYASLLCTASDIAHIVKQMVSKGQSFDSCSRMSLKERQDFFAEIIKAAGVKDFRSVRQAGYYFDAYKGRDDISFDGCRYSIRNKIGGGKENMPKVLATAKAESVRVFCLYSLEHVFQMQAKMDVPEVILAIKFFEFAMAHSAAFMTDFVVGVADQNEYARLFHVDSEGNYAEYQEENEDDEESANSESLPNADDATDTNEPVIGVDYPYYAVALSPNHLMYDADFAIRDNSTDAYVVGTDGKVLVFGEWKDAKKKRDELEANITA